MAKVKLFSALGEYQLVGDYYTDELLQFDENSTGKKAIYEDLEQNTDLVFRGEGIKYSEGHMIKGTVEEIVFVRGDGEVMYRVTDLEESAATINGMLGSTSSIDDILDHVLRHRDTITGSAIADRLEFDQGNDRINGLGGDDFISGGGGKDILTGGKGSDRFSVNEGSGHDVITDFHASGGDGVQDLLFGNMSMVTLTKQGDDLLVSYADGLVTLLLEGIKKSQIDDTDFTPFL